MTEKKHPIVRETVSLYDAKTHPSSLVDRAADAEEIVISKSGKPKARLVRPTSSRPSLVAQALDEGLTLLSKDRALRGYGVRLFDG